jgi:hypothetical protein
MPTSRPPTGTPAAPPASDQSFPTRGFALCHRSHWAPLGAPFFFAAHKSEGTRPVRVEGLRKSPIRSLLNEFAQQVAELGGAIGFEQLGEPLFLRRGDTTQALE